MKVAALILVSVSLPTLAASADEPSAMSLAQKNACLSCHSVEKKIVGPAFKDVAKKYRGDKGAEARLMTKVKTGGKGVWGEVPMPPNPQVNDADLKKIVAWILALN
jgi:cytochrome c